MMLLLSFPCSPVIKVGGSRYEDTESKEDASYSPQEFDDEGEEDST